MTSMEQGRHSLNEPERRRVMAQCQEYYAQSFLAANSTRGDRSTPGSRLNSADYSVSGWSARAGSSIFVGF